MIVIEEVITTINLDLILRHLRLILFFCMVMELMAIVCNLSLVTLVYRFWIEALFMLWLTLEEAVI